MHHFLDFLSYYSLHFINLFLGFFGMSNNDYFIELLFLSNSDYFGSSVEILPKITKRKKNLLKNY